jgi:hypothetical protein
VTGLTSIVKLSTDVGTRCPVAVIRGLLRNDMPLEMWCEDKTWKPLVQARMVFDGGVPGGVVYLYTTDPDPLQVSPDELLRVRFAHRTQKAGEAP